MKVASVSIRNVRGIRELDLRPEGQNLVIWGPNGAGKSGVIDAIDFLLTGRIGRLMGEGTAGISLKTHGPHVDVQSSDAYVSAVLLFEDDVRVEVTRAMDSPGVLHVSPDAASIRDSLRQLVVGQHVLTRREILRFVTSNAGTRAEQMRALLNLGPLESVRKALVALRTRAERELQAADGARAQAVMRFAPLVGSPNPQPAQALEIANKARLVLGGSAIDVLEGRLLKDGLKPPDAVGKGGSWSAHAVHKLLTTIETSRQEESLKTVAAAIQAVERSVDEFRLHPELVHEYRRRELLRLGLEFIEEDGRCPLCETRPESNLAERLQDRLNKSHAAHAKVEVFQSARDLVRPQLLSLKAVLDEITTFPSLDEGQRGLVQGWIDSIGQAIEQVSGDLEQLVRGLKANALRNILLSERLSADIGPLLRTLKSRASRLTPAQEAWDALTRIDEVLGLVIDAEEAVTARRSAAAVTSRLHATYCSAQDQVLQDLYSSIETQFTNLYRSLHESDEGDFKARLTPKETGLDFEVDFYGRAVGPPQGFHSEGHQDSMGICLFLTLYERLATGINFVLLDDVVMSVDSDHRRSFARLLGSDFSGRQFIITTHDRTWAHQLRTEGVVKSKNVIKFHAWAVETGPSLLKGSDSWRQVQEALDRDDVPEAAAWLRRGAEEHAQHICELLRAPVRFSTTAQWELGDLAPAAMSQLRKLLKTARRAARSWQQDDVEDRLLEFESTLVQISNRLDLESWSVNENVHYNSWASYSKADFIPVVEAMKDFFDSFQCASCEALLRLVLEGRSPSALKCACGNLSWNLLEK